MGTKRARRPRKTEARSSPSVPSSSSAGREALIDLVGLGLLFVGLFHGLFGSFFPTSNRTLGHDYDYFLPQLLAVEFWRHHNGWLTVPWFTPAFCGGVPFYPNPRSGPAGAFGAKGPTARQPP